MLALLAATLLAAPNDLAEAYKRADALPALTRGKALNLTLAPNWIGTDALWYRAERKNGGSEYIVATLNGSKRPLFDHTRLADALAKLGTEKVDSAKLALTNLEVAGDLNSMAFTYATKRYTVSFSDYVVKLSGTQSTVQEAASEVPDEEATFTEFPVPRAGATLSQQTPRSNDSPDGKWTVAVADGVVKVTPKAGGDAITLSQTPGFTQARWSRDSRYLVGMRLLQGERKQVHLLASSQRAATRAQLQSRFYDQPGDVLDRYEPYVFDVAAKTEKKVDVEPIMGGGQPWAGPPGVDMRDGRFMMDYPERGYQRFHVVQVDFATAKATHLVDESSPTFFDNTNAILRVIEPSNELLWRSERDGWGHLYLLDGTTGAVKNQVTKGDWVVRSVDNVDEKERTLTFMANGREPGDPYLQYLYRANLDGTDLKVLTPGQGNHRVVWARDRKSFIDTYSQINVPPVHEWRRADGTLVSELEKADISGLAEFKLKPAEPFVAKGRDGTTDIWGIVVKPTNFDRRKKYPVIENIYAGPHDSHVPKTYFPLLRMQRLAELGFIVVQIDGMGTRNRGKKFHDVCWQNLADAGFPDRISWMKALAAKDKSVDISRVGVYGTSAGGQNAAAALLFHPDFYKVGVASCGCHDNRIDKQWWNEQWMGYPVGPHYAKQSNIDNAGNLKGKLLLIVGELDRNVPPESTIRFADALQKAKKEFDFVVIPGADHTDGGDYGERKRRDFFVRWLLGKEPPEWNSAK